jgi:hypothetical protein
MKPLILIFTIVYSQFLLGQTLPLFKITQNEKVGYINFKGEIVIKPVYLSGFDFSDGLAAVRRNGLYGFIDETGEFIIKPEYDFATNFARDLALVYKDGKPQVINKQGKIALPINHKALLLLDGSRAIITTQTNKQGVIDLLSKKLLIDTVFSSIDDYKNGVFLVYEYIPPTVKQRIKKVGVIDENGKFIVPFGKYEKIQSFVEGFAVVEMEEGSRNGVIDTKGNLLFYRDKKDHSYIDGDFHNGYARVNLYKYWIPEEKGVSYTSNKVYGGFINLKGDVVLNDTTIPYVHEFSNGRAFVKKEDNRYILIDQNFKRVGNESYQSILNNGFKDNYAIVETNDGYGVIDTIGRFVVQPKFDQIDQVGIINGYFFFVEEDEKGDELIGIADIKGNIITKPILSEVDRRGFINGLIKAVIASKLVYINREGEIIWQQQEEGFAGLKSLNIDFMNRGYFYAYSSATNLNMHENGGFATSRNTPRPILNSQLPKEVLAITIDTAKRDTFANKYCGFKLFISNATRDTINFNAQDSRLYLKLQAQNTKGNWTDIEYLPSSWCGNSYHIIKLEPKAYWSFVLPKYQGEFQTNIRAELKFIDKNNPKKERIIYSSTFSGSINPGQFWNKRTYYPDGLMDPYND